MTRELWKSHKSERELFTSITEDTPIEHGSEKFKCLPFINKKLVVKHEIDTEDISKIENFMKQTIKVNSIMQFIQYRKITEIILELIPQLVLFIYSKISSSDFGLKDLIRILLGLFGCLVAPYSFAIYIKLYFKIKGVYLKRRFIILRTFTNYLFFTSRMFSIVMGLYFCKWLPFLLTFLRIVLHFIYFYISVSKERSASIIFISILKTISFCEDIDSSFYCVLYHAFAWSENVFYSIMYYSMELNNKNLNLLKTCLVFYVVLSLVFGFTVELIMRKCIFKTKAVLNIKADQYEWITLDPERSFFICLYDYELNVNNEFIKYFFNIKFNK